MHHILLLTQKISKMGSSISCTHLLLYKSRKIKLCHFVGVLLYTIFSVHGAIRSRIRIIDEICVYLSQRLFSKGFATKYQSPCKRLSELNSLVCGPLPTSEKESIIVLFVIYVKYIVSHTYYIIFDVCQLLVAVYQTHNNIIITFLAPGSL